MTSGLEMKGIYSQKKRQVREEISKKKVNSLDPAWGVRQRELRSKERTTVLHT